MTAKNTTTTMTATTARQIAYVNDHTLNSDHDIKSRLLRCELLKDAGYGEHVKDAYWTLQGDKLDRGIVLIFDIDPATGDRLNAYLGDDSWIEEGVRGGMCIITDVDGYELQKYYADKKALVAMLDDHDEWTARMKKFREEQESNERGR